MSRSVVDATGDVSATHTSRRGPAGMERREVFRSGRVKVTEAIVRSFPANDVLEIGAGDHSFRAAGSRASRWVRADLARPCDVMCDFNTDRTLLPFADRAFDLVVCTQVIEHLLWPQHLVAEAMRVLRPGGGFLVSVPNVVSLSYRIAWMLGRIPSCAASGNLPPELGSTAYRTSEGRYLAGHVVDFTRRRLENLLRHAGFEIGRTAGSGIIWHRQILPAWAVPPSLASNVICLAIRPE